MTAHATDFRALTDLIRTYQVRFAIQSSDVSIYGRAAEISLRLELSGYHDGPCGGAFCLGCNHVLRVLFEVSDALRPFEREAFKRAGYAYEKGARSASGRGRDREVVLGLQFTVRRPFARAGSGWGWRFIERITLALTQLGCRDLSGGGVSESRVHLGPIKVARAESDEIRASLAL